MDFLQTKLGLTRKQSQYVLIGLIILVVLYLSQKKQTSLPNTVTSLNTSVDWINTGYGYGYGSMNPAMRLPQLISSFGQPSVLDANSGGSAIWNKQQLHGTPYERIEIRDEQIPHDQPKKHTDFLYSWHKLYIPDHKVGGLHKISESLNYDALKHLVCARCHDMKLNIVSHWIVKKYAEDELSIDEAVGMYGPMIMEVMADSTGNKARQLEAEL
jgi:hypothetical protein